MLTELGLREMAARGRFGAWGVGRDLGLPRGC
ncbi:helix-turn-helix domain-containing protein [Rhizobium mesoamericanum]